MESGIRPFPIFYTSVPNPKSNDYTEVSPRNSKKPFLGIITMHKEEYLFFKAAGIDFIVLPRGEQELSIQGGHQV